MVSTPAAPIASPCLSICMVDGRSRHCIGCYRTLPEIAGWSRFTHAEREAIMQALPARGKRIAAEAKARAENSLPTGGAN